MRARWRKGGREGERERERENLLMQVQVYIVPYVVAICIAYTKKTLASMLQSTINKEQGNGIGDH